MCASPVTQQVRPGFIRADVVTATTQVHGSRAEQPERLVLLVLLFWEASLKSAALMTRTRTTPAALTLGSALVANMASPDWDGVVPVGTGGETWGLLGGMGHRLREDSSKLAPVYSDSG